MYKRSHHRSTTRLVSRVSWPRRSTRRTRSRRQIVAHLFPASSSSSKSSSSSRKRDIIIGVCVGIGGALWIALVYWIYRRVKRSNECAVHKRLSEHMSMFSGQPDYGARRQSMAPSFAASEVDDRPSSFYASPMDNYSSMRHRQHDSLGDSLGDIVDYSQPHRTSTYPRRMDRQCLGRPGSKTRTHTCTSP